MNKLVCHEAHSGCEARDHGDDGKVVKIQPVFVRVCIVSAKSRRNAAVKPGKGHGPWIAPQESPQRMYRSRQLPAWPEKALRRESSFEHIDNHPLSNLHITLRRFLSACVLPRP